MKLSDWISLGMTVAGGLAAGRVLQRRQQWEQAQRSVAICIDFDDATDAALRSALSFDALLQRLAAAGATHVSLPELTLGRLLQQGILTPQAPANPITEAAPLGHWNYLHGPSELVQKVARELCRRLPYTDARVLQGQTLAFAGNLPALRGIGLGFDNAAATRIAAQGLRVAPRPVSYDWPEPALIERTLAQAAQVGDIVAFAGDMILGHEMHLDSTVAALAQHDLTFVYFAESRHQKGDWFIAKRHAPRVVIGHHFSPQEMIPLDYHAAAHNWAHLARERGIRLCYIHFFRVLHATEPLEALHYVEHVRQALQQAGFEIDADLSRPKHDPGPTSGELGLTALAPSGIAAATVARTLRLSETAAVPLTIAAAGSAGALPLLEQRWRQRASNGVRQQQRHHHDHHHEHAHPREHGHAHAHSHEHAPSLQSLYTPSYTPKLLALATSTLAPLLALSDGGAEADRLWRLALPPAAAASLAAVTSDAQYILRIEAYRALGLDWLVPLTGATLQIEDRRSRLTAVVTLTTAWFVVHRKGAGDLLGSFDAPHPLGHTHHISTVARLAGDVGIWLGPRPARKWAALALPALSLYRRLASRGHNGPATAAGIAGAVAWALALSAFRQPQRHLALTARSAAPAYVLGAAVAALLEALEL